MTLLSILAYVFAKVGLGAFGGGLATIPFIHYELVMCRPWLSEKEFSEVISLAQMTPGPVAINAATFVGYRLAGIPGSIVSTLSLIVAPVSLLFVVTWLISKASGRWRDRVEKVQKALRPAVAGLLFVAFWMVAKPLVNDWRLWIFMAVGLGLIRFPPLKKYPQLLILFSALVGALAL